MFTLLGNKGGVSSPLYRFSSAISWDCSSEFDWWLFSGGKADAAAPDEIKCRLEFELVSLILTLVGTFAPGSALNTKLKIRAEYEPLIYSSMGDITGPYHCK